MCDECGSYFNATVDLLNDLLIVLEEVFPEDASCVSPEQCEAFLETSAMLSESDRQRIVRTEVELMEWPEIIQVPWLP